MATLVIGEGDFDLANVRALRSALHQAVDAGHPVIIDLTDVTFADSTAIAAIVGAYKKAQSTGTRLQVVALSTSMVRRVLDLTGITEVLTPYDSVDAALTSLMPTSGRTHGTSLALEAQAG